MRALSSTDLLRVWEAAQGRSHIEKGLALLREARPELDAEARFDLSVGQRDMHLLDLRRATFGHRFECVAACPACDERLEVEFTVDDVRADGAAALNEFDLTWEDYEVKFRVPTSRDLWRVRREANVPAARRALFLECISASRRGGAECDRAALPDDLMREVAGRMAAVDPQAEVRVELACAACTQVWTEGFDVVSYFWSEIHGSVGRLVREVHELAGRYGWSEESILGLSPMRRQMYLQWGQA